MTLYMIGILAVQRREKKIVSLKFDKYAKINKLTMIIILLIPAFCIELEKLLFQ
jgi:hypothetical protein